ncbi:MAG: hypothetical protein LBK41_03995 [Clostridiales bacterium]|nr:hypothetical protein [Clostridiales bacterium]
MSITFGNEFVKKNFDERVHSPRCCRKVTAAAQLSAGCAVIIDNAAPSAASIVSAAESEGYGGSGIISAVSPWCIR